MGIWLPLMAGPHQTHYFEWETSPLWGQIKGKPHAGCLMWVARVRGGVGPFTWGFQNCHWFTPTILFGHYGAAPGGRAANAVLDTSSGTLAPGLNQDWRLPKLFSTFFAVTGPPGTPIGPPLAHVGGAAANLGVGCARQC